MDFDVYNISKFLFKVAITCFVLIIAIGIDSLFFELTSLGSDEAYTLATIMFISIVAGVILSIWNRFDD